MLMTHDVRLIRGSRRNKASSSTGDVGVGRNRCLSSWFVIVVEDEAGVRKQSLKVPVKQRKSVGRGWRWNLNRSQSDLERDVTNSG